MSSGMQAADGITDLLFHSPPTALVSVLPPQDVPRTRVADQVYIDELTGDVVTLSSYETRPTPPASSSSNSSTSPPVTKRSCEARFYGNPVVPLEAVGSCGATSAASLQNDRETYQRTNYLITSITLATSSSKAGSSAKTIVAARRFPRPVQVRTAAATTSTTTPSSPTSPAAADGYELRYLVALSMDDQTIHFYITPPAYAGSGDLQPISVGSYACSPNTLRFRQSSYPIRGFQWCPNSAVSDHWRQHQSAKAASRASTPESLAELSLTATAAHTDDPTDVWANANRSFYYRSKVLLGGGGYSIPPPPETGDLPMKKLLKSLPPTAREKAHRIFQQACGSATGEALGLAETAHGVSLSSAVEQLHTCLQRDQLLMVWTEIGVDLVYVNFTRDSTTGVSAAQKRDAFEHLASPLGGASASSSNNNAEPSGIISPSTSGCTGMIVVLRRVPTRIDFWTTLPSMHVSLAINSAKATNVKPIAELGAYTWIMPQFKIPGLNPITPPAAPKYRTQQAAIAAARLPQSFVANMQFPTTGPHLSTNMLFPTIASTEAGGGTPPAFATGAWSQTSHCSHITQPQSFYPLQVLQLHDELYIAFVDYSKGHVVMYRYQHNNHSGRTADLGSTMLSDDYGDRYAQWAQNNSTVTTTNRSANPARSGASTLVRYFNAAVDSGVTPGSSFASAERRAGGGPDAMTALPGAADLLRGASEANLTEEEKDHILRIASEAAAAIAEDVKGLDVEGLTGSDGFRGNLRRLKVGSKLQPLSDYASDPYKVVDQEFQVGALVAEGQPMPALTTLSSPTQEYGSGGVSAPLSNLAAHALLGRGLQGISAAASTNKKSSSSSSGGGGGVPLPCAFVPIPDVVAQVVSALEKGAPSSGTSTSGNNQQGGGQHGDASNGNVARPPTMGLSTQQPGAGAGSASQSSVLTSKGTSCFVSCYPSARGGAAKDGKGFVPSDPSMSGGSMSAAGEQQEGSMATFVVAFVLPLPAHSIVSALRAEWYFGADVQATHRWSEALRAAADDTLLTSSNTPLLPPYAVLLQTTSDGLLIAHIPDDGKLAQEIKSEIDGEQFDPLLDGGGSSSTGGGGVSHEEDSQRVAEEVLRPCHLVAAYDVKLAMLKDDTSAASGVLAQQQRGLSPMDSNYYSSIRQQQIASTAVSAAGRFVAQHAGLFLKQLHVLPIAPPAPLNSTGTTLTPADTQAIEALEAYELTKTQYLEQSKQIMSDFNCHDARAQCTRYMASYTSHFSYHRLAPFSPVAFAELKDQIIEATSMEAMQTSASTSKGPSRKIARRLHRAMVEGKAQWITSLMAARFQELSNQRSEAARRTVDGVSSVPPTSLYSTDSTFQELARNMYGAVALAMANGGDVGGRWSNTTTTASTAQDSKRGTMRPSGKQGSSLVATMAAVEAQQRMSSAARGSMAADSNNNSGSSKGGWFRNLFNKNRDDGSGGAGNNAPNGSDAALVLTTEGTDVHEGVPIVHHLPLWCLEGALPNSILDKLVQSPRGNTSIPPVAQCAGSTRVVIGGSQPRLLNSWSTPTVPTLAMLGDMGLAPSSPHRSHSNSESNISRPPVHLLPPSYRFVSTIVGYNAMAIVRSFGVDHEAMWSWWPIALRRLMLQGTLSTDQLDALDGIPAEDESPPGSTVSSKAASSRQKHGRLSALPPMSVTGGLSCPRSRLPFGVYDTMFIFAVQFLLYRRAHTVVAYKEAAIEGGNDGDDVDDTTTTSSSSVFVVPFAEIASRLALHTALNFESLSLVGRIFDVMVAHQRSHISECSWFNFWQSRWRGAMVADAASAASTSVAASNVSLTDEATQSWRSLLIGGFLLGSSLTNVTTSTPDTTAEFVRYVRSLYQPQLWSINSAYHVGGGSTRRELLLSTYSSNNNNNVNSMGSTTSSTDDIGGSGGVDGRLSLHLVRPAVDAGHMYRSVFEELLRVSESCRATTSIQSQQSFGPSGARLDGVFVRNYVLHCFFEYARSLVQHGLSLSVPLQSSLIDLMLSTAKPLPQQQQQQISNSNASSSTPPNATTISVASSGAPTPTNSLGGRSPVSAYSEPHQGSDSSATESSYFRLHQLLMYRALEDHVPTALQLISLHSDYPPAFQLGLDILSRLRAHSEIIMVFLSKGMPLRAAKYLLSLKRETIAAHVSLTRQLVKLQSGGGDKDEDPTGENARRTQQNLQTVSQQLYPSNTDLFSVIGILDSAAAMHDAELLALSAEGEVTPGPTLAPGEEDPRTERQKVTVYLRNRLITKRQKYKQELGAAGAQFYSIYTLVVTQYLDLAVRSRSNDGGGSGGGGGGGASKNGSFTNTSSSSSATQLLLHFPNLKPFKVRYDLINSGNISGLYLLLIQNNNTSAGNTNNNK